MLRWQTWLSNWTTNVPHVYKIPFQRAMNVKEWLAIASLHSFSAPSFWNPGYILHSQHISVCPGHISSAWQHVTHDCKARWHMSRSTHQFTGNAGTEERRKWHQEDARGESRLCRFYVTTTQPPQQTRKRRKKQKDRNPKITETERSTADFPVVQWLRLHPQAGN